MTRLAYRTFGCKANQYDTERIRQELEARGGTTVPDHLEADVCVVNTCTVTNQADAEARSWIRRVRRENPAVRVVVAGCSAALRAAEYREMDGVAGVVPGHDPVHVALALPPLPAKAAAATPAAGAGAAPGAAAQAPAGALPAGATGGSAAGAAPSLVQLGVRTPLDRMDREPVASEILVRREGATRGWLKIQDGCDRRCAFCATRLARGRSRSRPPTEVVAEAAVLARAHPELVLTGIHIGHYGRDLDDGSSLSRLVARLLEEVPGVRLRLGSVEATEIDDLLLDLLESSGGRLAPHLHMPLQSGADPVLRRMRRWHTRETYRARALQIAERFDVLGLGADIITGFPGETDEDHARTVALVEELPYTYLHVFPFSPRDGTVAAELQEAMPVPQRVAGERSRELRDIVRARGAAYRRGRSGGRARVALEGGGCYALTEDYLRVPVANEASPDPRRLHDARLVMDGGDLAAHVG